MAFTKKPAGDSNGKRACWSHGAVALRKACRCPLVAPWNGRKRKPPDLFSSKTRDFKPISIAKACGCGSKWKTDVGPQIEMSSLVLTLLTIQLLGYLILTHTHVSDHVRPWLVGGWNNMFFFHFIYRMSSETHWRTHIFQDGYCTTNQLGFFITQDVEFTGKNDDFTSPRTCRKNQNWIYQHQMYSNVWQQE